MPSRRGWGSAGLIVLAAGALIAMPLASAATPADRVGHQSKKAVWASISTGQDHTCGIRTDGTLWCWGYNRYGQLGLDDIRERDYPTRVGDATDWVDIDLGGLYSCGLRADHTLWCWGVNTNGELGVGDSRVRHLPTQVGTDEDWAALSAGTAHTCGLRLNGTLWCWGKAENGRLGNGNDTDQHIPLHVDHGTFWSGVSAGGTHTCGIRRGNQSLWCWGSNYYGQLGQGNYRNRYTPRPVERGSTWSAISAGTAHTCAIATDGGLWCWGDNESGELGVGDHTVRIVPAQVGTDVDWSSVVPGGPTCFDHYDCAPVNHTCGTRSDHTLWCWGDNDHGGLGTGDTDQRLVPTQVNGIMMWDVIGTGGEDSCGTGEDHTLWCWGAGTSGKLGLGDRVDRLVPTQVIGRP